MLAVGLSYQDGEKLTVVFDLDETLVSVKQQTQGANFELPVRVKDKIVKVDSF